MAGRYRLSTRTAITVSLSIVLMIGAATAASGTPPDESPGGVGGPGIADLPAVPAQMLCEDLLSQDFTGVEGAPTRLDTAQVVSDATLVTEGGEVTLPPYCEVKGYVAGQVRFELRLPMSAWTQRFLMLGCGGYCGVTRQR